MWQFKIQDPSGETRLASLRAVFGGRQENGAPHGEARLGRDPSSELALRDATAPLCAGALVRIGDQIWFRATGESSARLGDLDVREARMAPGLSLRIGESRLSLERAEDDSLTPQFPASVLPWLTRSESGRKLLWMTMKAATTPLSVYLAGETGIGKEVLAHLVHAWSERARGPFVPLHCAALAQSLAESELFGHVKGAFTGAIHQRPGALLQAHGGTLFLDEVGDLPMEIQIKLLRFLENGEVRPVGADRPSHADVRIICATHHSLLKLVEEGKFRRDLYYRLASVTIEIPTLRSRPEDIELLARKFAADLGKTLSPRALLRLQVHTWPGNVRELRHAVERAAGLAGALAPMLSEESFDFLLTPENISAEPELEMNAPILTLEEMEKVMLVKALRLSHGNRAAAARVLGIARSTLFEMIKRHRIVGPRASMNWDFRASG